MLYVLAWVSCLREWYASMGGMGGLLAWVVWVLCQHGRHASVLAWMTGLHGKRASMDGV